MIHDDRKEHGIHYTPPDLAAYLADLALDALGDAPTARVLDPACGDGELLVEVVQRARPTVQARLQIVGIDRETNAVAAADRRLRRFTSRVEVFKADFLELVESIAPPPPSLLRRNAPPPNSDLLGKFDLVIANPPYVRTQVLGSDHAKRLRAALGLTGRVDLYHGFVATMTRCLRDEGVLALLCSNRFLTTQSGKSMRTSLARDFQIERIVDLGDTRPFAASVLPAIVIARRTATPSEQRPIFLSSYESRETTHREPPHDPNPTATPPTPNDGDGDGDPLFAALRREEEGSVVVGADRFTIRRGTLAPPTDGTLPWTLTSSDHRDWLRLVEERTHATFRDVGRSRVGIKTTADVVFVRDDWDDLPAPRRPEEELLHPLLTHEIARPFVRSQEPTKRVLYPHLMIRGKREAIALEDFPKARAYLLQHFARLDSRTYLKEAGRRWYEIWVPQNPDRWKPPKIVFPDISEHPRFFLDRSGAIVGGDCYWITPDDPLDEEILFLMLGVANSTFAERFYDLVCGNRLYSGRRRFISQYVDRFPLPDPTSSEAREIVARVRRRLGDGADDDPRIEPLVWRSFGLQPPREDRK